MKSFSHAADSGNNQPSSYLYSFLLVISSFWLLSQLPFMLELSLNPNLKPADFGDFGLLATKIGKNKLFLYLLVPFALTLGINLLAIRLIHKRPILSVFTSREKFDWNRFSFSFAIWGVILLTFLFVTFLVIGNLRFQMNLYHFLILCLISLVLVPLQTTCEEVFFRGHLFQWIGQKKAKGWIPVLMTGTIFGLIHLSNPEIEVLGTWVIFYYIITGYFLGILVQMDDGLELSMGYHAANNLFASVFLTNNWQSFQTDALFVDMSAPHFGWEHFLTLLIVQPLLLLIFQRKYRWGSFREGLFQ